MAAEPSITALEAEVAEFRRLAEADSDHLYPGLAQALSDLSAAYRDGGRLDEAVAAAREAVAQFAVLAGQDDQFRAGLAMATANLGARWQDAGDRAAALETARQAVDLAASLGAGDPAATILATSRFNLAVALLRLDAVAEAGGVMVAAGRSIRQLFETGQSEPAAFLVRFLMQCAKAAEGQGAWLDLLTYQRGIAEALPGDPPAGRAMLAHALDKAAESLAPTDPVRALAHAEEAVTVLRRVAGEAGGRAYGGGLADLARRWLRLAGAQDDPIAAERAARAMAAIAAAESEERAGALTMLAVALSDQGRPEEAVAAAAEAADAWNRRKGAETRLAAALNIQATALAGAGRLEEAVAAAGRAADLWRRRPSLDPDRDGALFADTLRRLGGLLARTGQVGAALAVAEEGLRLSLSSVLGAGVADADALAAFERLRGECLAALGKGG